MTQRVIEARGAVMQSGMEYRRFGRTDKLLSTITLGGMRYDDGWSSPRDEPHPKMVEHCIATIERGLSSGINHIETAWGYGKSEYCHGLAIKELGLKPADFFLMTKGTADSADAMKARVEEQLKGLQVDKIDLYGYHGINNQEILQSVLRKGGPLDALEELQRQGVIGNIGFSTHGFDFVNLHYYYFLQRNYAAIQLAEQRDMGVFIISPNDKGGQLYNPSKLLKELILPFTPIQWNARFCLRLPSVHTLSFGMNEPEHFAEMRGIFPTSIPLSPADLRVEQRLNSRLLDDPLSGYMGYEFQGDPSGINIPEVLRFRRMVKCYDMKEFAQQRYNMFQSKGHFFPGSFATDEAIADIDESRIPSGVPLKEMLRETHALLFKSKNNG